MEQIQKGTDIEIVRSIQRRGFEVWIRQGADFATHIEFKKDPDPAPGDWPRSCYDRDPTLVISQEEATAWATELWRAHVRPEGVEFPDTERQLMREIIDDQKKTIDLLRQAWRDHGKEVFKAKDETIDILKSQALERAGWNPDGSDRPGGDQS